MTETDLRFVQIKPTTDPKGFPQAIVAPPLDVIGEFINSDIGGSGERCKSAILDCQRLTSTQYQGERHALSTKSSFSMIGLRNGIMLERHTDKNRTTIQATELKNALKSWLSHLNERARKALGTKATPSANDAAQKIIFMLDPSGQLTIQANAEMTAFAGLLEDDIQGDTYSCFLLIQDLHDLQSGNIGFASASGNAFRYALGPNGLEIECIYDSTEKGTYSLHKTEQTIATYLRCITDRNIEFKNLDASEAWPFVKEAISNNKFLCVELLGWIHWICREKGDTQWTNSFGRFQIVIEPQSVTIRESRSGKELAIPPIEFEAILASWFATIA